MSARPPIVLKLSERDRAWDPRTGDYVPVLSFSDRVQSLLATVTSVPAPVKWLACAGALWVSWEAAQWAVSRAKLARLRRRASNCNDIEELANVLYSIAPAHLGGFLTNAKVQAVERAGQGSGSARANNGSSISNNILLFATGGWRFTPHSLSAVPLLAPYRSAAASVDARSLWWLPVTLGKSMVLNGALAFIVSSRLMLAEKDEQQTLFYKGRKVVDVGFNVGSLYNSLSPLQRSSNNSSAASSSGLSSSLSVTPIDRIDLVCEIGTLSQSRLQEYQSRHWGGSPDHRGEELEQVADFGTTRVYDHWLRTRVLPSAASPGFEEVLWEKRAVNPPQGREGWLYIDVEGLTDDISERERIHLDLAAHFAKGISAGFGDQRRAVESAESFSAVVSVWSKLCSSLSQLSMRLSPWLPSSLGPALSSTSPLGPSSSLPLPVLLSDSLIHGRDGLNSRVTESAQGARDVIQLLQRKVLINSEAPNTTHAQLRSLLLEALQLMGMRNRYVAHKLPAAKKRSGRDTASPAPATPPADAGEATPHTQASHSKHRQSKGERDRAKRRAKERATAAATVELASDEDEDGVTTESVDRLDTESPVSEVDQVD
jgi:hypothetical protein